MHPARVTFAFVDGLRGLAVLLVLASHIGGFGYVLVPFVSFQGIGKAGVYLFFVLSAWLLGGYVLAQRAEWGLRYWLAYALRRIGRIFPLYWLVLVACYVLAQLQLPYWVIPLDAQQLFRHLLLQEGAGVFWAIPVEFGFYVLLPLLAGGLMLLGQRQPYWALACCAAGVWLPSLLPLGPAYQANTTQLWPYFSAFAVGLALAYGQHAWGSAGAAQRLGATGWGVLGWLALALVGLSIPGVATATGRLLGMLGPLEALPFDYLHGQVLAYGLLWGLVLWAAQTGGAGLGRVVSSPVLVWVGERSFSIYLCHIPVLRVVKQAPLEHPLLAGWLAVGLTLVLAHLSFTFIEKPGMRLARMASRGLQGGQQKVGQ